MAGLTKGKYKILGWAMRQETAETKLYLALCTDTDTPGADTNTLSQLEEIGAGNGYTSGGNSISMNSTDFDVWTEDDSDDDGEVQIKDTSWTASGGDIPASGDGISYLVLTDDNATVASREVYDYCDVEDSSTPRTITSGGTTTFQNSSIKLTES